MESGECVYWTLVQQEEWGSGMMEEWNVRRLGTGIMEQRNNGPRADRSNDPSFHYSDLFADSRALGDPYQFSQRLNLHFFHHPRAVDLDGFFYCAKLKCHLLVQ